MISKTDLTLTGRFSGVSPTYETMPVEWTPMSNCDLGLDSPVRNHDLGMDSDYVKSFGTDPLRVRVGTFTILTNKVIYGSKTVLV